MTKFPITYFEDNIVFANGDIWAGFKISGESYEFMSSEKKIDYFNKLGRFIADLGEEAQILVVPTGQDSQHYSKLIDQLNPEDILHDIATIHAEGVKNYLQQKEKKNGAVTSYSIFVFVRITVEAKHDLKSVLADPIKALSALFTKQEISKELVAKAKIESRKFISRQQSRLDLCELAAEEVQALIKNSFRRGTTNEMDLNPNCKFKNDAAVEVRQNNADILALAESKLSVRNRYVEIDTAQDELSFQTFLTISSIPEKIGIPGGEWLLAMQNFVFPTEVCIHVEKDRDSESRLDRKAMEIDSQAEYIAETSRVPKALSDAKSSAAALKEELKSLDDSLVRASVSICIAGTSPESLIERSDFLRARFKDFGFTIEKPLTDQLQLFMQHLPCAGRYVPDYAMYMTPQSLATSMFAASNHLGDADGHYVGETGLLNQNVYLDMSEACRLNRSASAAILGTLGGGKSFLANLLVLLHVLRGARALIIDPKGERELWPNLLSGLADEITITQLCASDDDAGKLDPFVMYADDIGEACELAKNIICELYHLTSKDDEYIVLADVLSSIEESKQRSSMKSLMETLKNYDDAEFRAAAVRLSKRMRATAKLGLSKLLFSDGTVSSGINFDKRINIVQIQNIKLPEPDTPKESYSDEETISTVLMIPIAHFAKKFAMTDRNVFKVAVLDESWALNQTVVGASLFNFLARMGRSLNVAPIFIGHSVSDLRGDGIKNAITYKFCFKSEDRDEIDRVLDFCDLEKNDENRDMIAGLGNGQCIFQDLHKNIGILRVDAVWGDFVETFTTTPGG